MKVFISYRRADSQWPADRVYEALKAVIPTSDIFLDIDKIPLGIDFRKYIDGRVSECDVLLALIGPAWLNIRQEDGERRRLDDPDDFVRLEIASALARGIPVVPILLDGTPLPTQEQLPSDLMQLTTRNAMEIRRTSFDADVARLVRGLALPAQMMDRRKRKMSRRAVAILSLLAWLQFTAAFFIAGLMLWSDLSFSEGLYRTVSAFGMWDEYFNAQSPLIEFVRFGALICLAWLIILVSWTRLADSLRTARIRWTIWLIVVVSWFSLGMYLWRDLPLLEAVYRTLSSLSMWDEYFNAQDALRVVVGWVGSVLPALTLLFGFWNSVRRSLAETFLEQ